MSYESVQQVLHLDCSYLCFFTFFFKILPFLFHFRFQLLLHIYMHVVVFALVQPEFVLLFLLNMGLCNKFYNWAAFCVALSLSKFTFSFSSLSLTLCELSVCGATSFTPRLLLPVLFHHLFLFQILHFYGQLTSTFTNTLCTIWVCAMSFAP